MSEHLPVVSGKELIRVIEKCGWQIRRQTGSHVLLYKPDSGVTLPVPNHKTVSKGTLHAILKDADITIQTLRKLL
ncbi:MAG: type II toxin-antitoxin system HicA family toxin [Candidatus Kapaibacteriota bacterium]